MGGRFDVPTEWYGIFCAVAKAGNITQAAERLFVSQPAVSMAVRQLEQRLGHPLFVRSSRGVTLTPEGKVLYSYLEKAMGLIDAAEQKYLEMTRLERGSVSIGASDTLCSHYLLPYLERYNAAYPDISIKVTNRTSMETLEILKAGEVDFGFVNLPVAAEAGLEITRCLDIADCLVGGSSYASLAETGLPLARLEEYPLLMLEKTSNTRRFLDAFAAENGVALRPILELGSSALLLEFARINLGLAFVIREFVKDFLEGSTLFEIPLSPPPPARAVGLVKLKGIPLSFAAQRFIELVLS